MVSFKELHSGQKGISKRYSVSGLKNGSLRIYPSDGVTAEELNVYLNSRYPWNTGEIPFTEVKNGNERYFEIKDVSGTVAFSW
ncbi:hypothetical protein ADICYQ_5693 [Cyclobacterium qasimii M12-11B]|nr:hypothetical protein ADICYQ_5693 [Cyclobacterium qasimii M12-11B]